LDTTDNTLFDTPTDTFAMLFDAMEAYYPLKPATKEAIKLLLHKRKVAAKEMVLYADTRPQYVSFVCSGLFSYYTLTDNGDEIIKIFFAENSFMASTAALMSRTPSKFAIKALEDSEVIDIDFYAFKKLSEEYIDIAQFWIHYLSQNWVVAKEENEINLKYLTAKERYELFKRQQPHVVNRIMLKDMASYLGITPTQMSRIRNAQHM
jgi:CRP-like cAMP-binding protein